MSLTHLPNRYVIGNWKMHGNAQSIANFCAESAAFWATAASELANVRSLICPPFPYLATLRQQLGQLPIGVGAQDVSAHDQGAYTGEVAASMLADLGCRYVLVGHSERRQYHGESSDTVAQKAQLALQHGITPIVCVGETLADKQADRTFEVVQAQLAPLFALGSVALSQALIAYEPVWAIGTGLTATPEQAQAVHAAIAQYCAQAGAAPQALLYGGSVKPDNTAALLAMPDIHGVLVGGASLSAPSFFQIAQAASRC